MDIENLKKRIEETVSGESLFLVDFIIRGDNKLRIIEVFIDGEAGITSEICMSVSNSIKNLIETENLLESNFRLDVSSPGTDRPLKFLKQYNKHMGRSFELLLNREEMPKSFKAKLTRIDGDILLFSDGKNEIQIRFEEIKSAKVLISF